MEDNTINRELSAELLRMLGAEVEVAQNGRQAVEAVLGHPALYYDGFDGYPDAGDGRVLRQRDGSAPPALTGLRSLFWL